MDDLDQDALGLADLAFIEAKRDGHPNAVCVRAAIRAYIANAVITTDGGEP